jgi:hypothetical protein
MDAFRENLGDCFGRIGLTILTGCFSLSIIYGFAVFTALTSSLCYPLGYAG